MGSFSLFHWLIVLITLAIMIIPMWKLLPRSGMPAPIALVSIIPFGLIILLWIMAFKRWPEDR